MPNNVRDDLRTKMGAGAFAYVIDAIGGESQWEQIDVPAHGGRWEVLTPDGGRYNSRLGIAPKVGTWMSNIMDAIKARKAEMEKHA